MSRRFPKFYLAVIVFASLFAVFGLVYGAFAWRYWRNLPKLTRNITAELNAPVLAIPADQKAWPIYRDVLMELTKDRPEVWQYRSYFQSYAYEEDVAQFLKRHEAQLQRAREAAKLPSLGHTLADEYPLEDLRLTRRFQQPVEGIPAPKLVAKAPSENPMWMGVLLTPPSESRDMIDVLSVDALLAARSGDGARTEADLLALLGIARQLREIPLSVNELSGLRNYVDALWLYGGLLAKYPDSLDDARLKRLDKAFREYDGGRITMRVDAERDCFADMLQRIYTDDGQGDGRACLTHLNLLESNRISDDFFVLVAAPLWDGRLAGRRESMEAYDRLLDIFKREIERPYWECRCHDYEVEYDKVQADRRLRLVSLMAISSDGIHRRLRDTVQQRDAVLAASALVRYRRDEKKWPDSLDRLVPNFLTKVPLDELSGKTLGYKVVDDKPILYSIGFDEVDDHGEAAELPPPGAHDNPNETTWNWTITKGAGQTMTGDLIVWPPEFRQVKLPPEPNWREP